MKVKNILEKKGPEVITIGQNKSMLEAIKILTANKIGALLVLSDNGRIGGIISERDIVRNYPINHDHFHERPVSEIMTRDVIIVEPEDDIEYVESVMTHNRIRHLPVVSEKVLVGIISIGDVVNAMLRDKDSTNKYLMDYISGNIPKQ
ncbi:MAG: CBS domain-containing protein [Candidatus Kapaibacterium sp.]